MVNCNINYSYCFIRIISCLGIVLLHLITGAVGIYGYTLNIHSVTIIDSVKNLLLWCVPCFIMVTGALLLNPEKEITFNKLFKRYLLRILYALVFCCIIFTTFDFVMHKNTFTIMTFVKILENIIFGKSWSHLWYLYLLIGIYLMLPLYRIISKHATQKELRYLLVLYFIFLSIIPSLSLIGINIAFYILVSTVYPFYLFYGYAFSKGIIQINKKCSLLLFLFSSFAIILLSSLKAFYFPDSDITFNYSFVFVTLQSVSLFSFINNYDIRSNNVIKSLDSSTFGIYLIHMIFIRLILKYLNVNPFAQMPIFSLFMIFFSISFISYLIVMFLKKIPGLKAFL